MFRHQIYLSPLLGLIPKELPFAKSNYVVRTFRHAVALDERRAKFKANLWDRTTDEDAALAAPKKDDYVSKKKREQLRGKTETRRNDSLYSPARVVGGVVGGVSSVAGSMAGAVGTVGGYVASTVGSAVGYSTATSGSDSAKPRRRWVPHGSGVLLDSHIGHANARNEQGEFSMEEPPRRRPSRMSTQDVAHAIGGRHIEHAETDVEGGCVSLFGLRQC